MKISQVAKNGGFTLIELMIVVIIIAILATIAVPSYQRYVTKSRMEEAKAKLSENYLYMEKMYNKNNGYLLSKGGAKIESGNLPNQQSGKGKLAYDYTVTVSTDCQSNTNKSDSKFCLKATPRTTQMNAVGGGKECGTLMVDQSGQYYIKPQGGVISNNTKHDGITCF